MTSSARDRAIEAVGCSLNGGQPAQLQLRDVAMAAVDALIARPEVLCALAGEVPAPAAGKPFRLACFGCSTWQEFPTNAAREEWVWAHEREVGCTEFRYSNEPVPLVPAGGSAPQRQGATTDVTRLLARLGEIEDWARRMTPFLILTDPPVITTDEVRAWLGAATTTAPEATP